MDYQELLENVMANRLTIDERFLIVNVLENQRAAKIALMANKYFMLGHPLTKMEGGAFYEAAKELNIHPDSVQRNYDRLYPKRTLMVEKKVEPALSFPIL